MDPIVNYMIVILYLYIYIYIQKCQFKNSLFKYLLFYKYAKIRLFLKKKKKNTVLKNCAYN